MKKIIVSAVALSTAFLASCNLNSSDEGNTEVASVEKLPDCNVKGGPSGDGSGGQRMYVEDEKAYYTCTGRGWMISQVTGKDDLPKCSAKENPKLLGQAVLASKDSLYFVCLPSGWVKLDSSNIDPEDLENLLDPDNPDSPLNPDSPENAGPTPMYEKLMVVGSSNVLAPFAEGSRVTIKEVAVSDSDKVSKNVHKGAIVGKTGDFLVPGVTVYSHYGEIAVKGVFTDPLTGKKSSDSLELRSFIEFNETSYSVSIYDHVLGARVKRLVSEGISYSDAFEQASRELYSTLGFDYENDFYLSVPFTVGLLLRADLEVKDFAKILETMSKDFAEDGVWKDDSAAAAIADFAFALHKSKLKVNDELVTEQTLRKNLEVANVAGVPDFESLIQRYYENVYDLGVCGSARQNDVVQNQNTISMYANVEFECDGEGYWFVIEKADPNSGEDEPGEDPIDNPADYVYTNRNYSGRAKVVGPFAVGTRITMTDVNVEGKVKPMDNQVSGRVLSKTGDLLISNANGYSNYGVISAKGAFVDVLTGAVSKDTLELKVLEAYDGDFQISVFHHILSERVKHLMNDGNPYTNAVDQARQELFASFGLDVNAYGESAEFAIALLLRADMKFADFKKRLDRITADFAEDGLWSEDSTKAAMADFAFELHNSKLKVGEKAITENDIRMALESNNWTDIPSFEKYIQAYYENVYGLGYCGSGHQNAIVKNANKSSRYADTYFTCGDYWYESSDDELDTLGFGAGTDGELKKGKVSDNWYAYDELISAWDAADPVAVAIGYSCTNNIENKVVSVDDQYYGCKDRLWKSVEESDYLLGRLCGSDIYDNTKYYTLEGVNNYYRCNGDNNWEPISEETYVSYNYENDGKVVTIGGHSYIYDNGYNGWRLAKDGEAELGVCNSDVYGSFKSFEAKDHTEYRYCDANYNWITVSEIDFLAKKRCSSDEYDFKVSYEKNDVAKYAYCDYNLGWIDIDYLTYNYGFCNNDKYTLAATGSDEKSNSYECGCTDGVGDFFSTESDCEGLDIEWTKQ